MPNTPNPISLENNHIRLTLDRHTGAILQIHNKPCAIDLMVQPSSSSPWRLELANQPEWLTTLATFEYETHINRQSVHLTWTTASGLTVTSTVDLSHPDGLVGFTASVSPAPGQAIEKLEYPIFPGIGPLSPNTDSYLTHPQGTGFLFRNPATLFESEPLRRQGLRYSPYPEGFSGSSMQFMAYYAAERGGFYLAAHDPTRAMKWLNVFKAEDGLLESTFIHQNPDIAAGRPFEIPYPVVIAALTEGNWYEPAERYKAWATQQSWTQQGPLSTRDDVSRWLLDDVGYTTFGINAAHDRSAWLDYFHETIGVTGFHILGVNWPKAEADYRGHIPGGQGDWFPAQFSPENLETIRRNGDYWAPFEFDLLLGPDGSESDAIHSSKQVFPEEKHSFDPYNFPFSCPAAPMLAPLHRWRDERLVAGYDADALYYDISVNNVLLACRSEQHGHPVGGGAWFINACGDMYSATSAAVDAAKGAIVPQGAEMISEVFIPTFDFYQARAEASPLSTFEADFFRPWILSGDVEKIPLFTFVYHEYGPVRLDGWGKPSTETGDLFYWVAARVALWGGLYELNYEFSALETLNGQDDDPTEHYYPFEPRSYPFDPAKLSFVRDLAHARTTFAHPYLVYGAMQRPLAFDTPSITLDYFLYNAGTDRKHYEERGVLSVPSIIHSAWRSPEGNVAFLFVNLRADATQTISPTIDPTRYGLPDGTPYHLVRVTRDSSDAIARSTGPTSVELVLQPRCVTMLEFRRAS